MGRRLVEGAAVALSLNITKVGCLDPAIESEIADPNCPVGAWVFERFARLQAVGVRMLRRPPRPPSLRRRTDAARRLSPPDGVVAVRPGFRGFAAGPGFVIASSPGSLRLSSCPSKLRLSGYASLFARTNHYGLWNMRVELPLELVDDDSLAPKPELGKRCRRSRS